MTSKLPNVSLSGWMRSGKDTVADYLVENHGYTKVGFADALRREVSYGVGCHPDALNEEPLRSQVRHVLQFWGTEFRRAQDPDYWVKQLMATLDDLYPGPFVVPDVRFINEVTALNNLGFLLVKVDMDVNEVMDYLSENGATYKDIHEKLSHPSEQEWQDTKFDVVLPSVRGDIPSLLAAVESQIINGEFSHA